MHQNTITMNTTGRLMGENSLLMILVIFMVLCIALPTWSMDMITLVVNTLIPSGS